MATDDEILLTVEEFSRRPDPGYPEELVKGRIVRMSIARPYHGLVCGNVSVIVGSHAKSHRSWLCVEQTRA